MSWKSFVTAGLLCLLASPVLAVPLVEIVPGGTFASNHLNEDGDWVWHVRIYQTDDPIVDVDDGGSLAPGSPLGVELGFKEMVSTLLSAANLNDGFDFTSNPGNGIFGWEVLSDTDGDGSIWADPPTNSIPDPDDEPAGVQTNLNEIFSALGSVDYLTDVDGKGYLEIIIDGPNTSASLSTNIVMSGDYGTAQGRVAELNDGFNPALPTSGTNPYSVNYDIYDLDVTREAMAGDADLDGNVNIFDFQALDANYGQPGTYYWYQGDFNGDETVNIFDFQALDGNYGSTYTVGEGGSVGGGAGGGGNAPVPEPTSAALALIAGSLLLGRRNRS